MGCLKSEAGCYLQRASCSCSNDCPTNQCPSPDMACPSAVPGSATCLTLPTPSMEGCTCGCTSCMSVCDGIGTGVGANGANVVFASWNLDAGQLPSSGTLGIYVRARGRTDGLRVAAGAVEQPLSTAPAGIRSDFGDFIVPDAATWSDPAMRPDSVHLGTIDTTTVAEIDCVVPFVVP
jgi:hypothetical protein